MKEYFVYLLRSEVNPEKFYLGVSYDLKRRLSQHDSGNSHSTKSFSPWKLVYSEGFSNKLDAYTRELYLKSPLGYLDKKAIIDKIKADD